MLLGLIPVYSRTRVLDSSVLTHHVQRDHAQRESLEVRGTQT